MYTSDRTKDWDFRVKNFLVYLASDFTASFAKIFFEARKQLVQMCNYEMSLSQIGRSAYLGWFPLAFRDLAFRSILLGFYYGTIDVEHKPTLKYSIP